MFVFPSFGEIKEMAKQISLEKGTHTKKNKTMLPKANGDNSETLITEQQPTGGQLVLGIKKSYDLNPWIKREVLMKDRILSTVL